jgi:sortase B
MFRKTVKFLDRSLDRVVLIIALLFFLVCVYAMVDAAMVYYNANDTSVLKYKPTLNNTEILRELSDDAVAWLTVDDTNIDYPVMQGKDNSEYLNKDPYGKYSLSGSIFLDSRCKGDFTGKYSLIYGHHMEYGAMFGALDEFSKPEFFNTHRTGTLITVGGTVYKIDFFACTKAQATEAVVFNPEESRYAQLNAFLMENALIYEEPAEEKSVIALSTCQSAETIERKIVFGTMTEIKK